jgi:predicted dehydrogenase
MNIGTIGAGGIAVKMAQTVAKIPGLVNYAIASRSLEKAQAFKKDHNFTKAYGSYEDLVKDPEVDLVYIATPHSEHYKNMLLCLKYHKPVLCEKAFCANSAQAKDIIRKFESEKVFLTEAIWTRYMPVRKTLDEILKSGIIGEPYLIQANLNYPIKSHARLTDPNLAGGALLDVGIYPLTFALMAFGDGLEKISAHGTYTETGVDETDVIYLSWPGQKQAVLYASMDGPSDRSGFIYGSKGYIQSVNINYTERIDVYDAAHALIKSVPIPFGISGYEWELYETQEALKQGSLFCPSMPHEETIRVMEILDEIRKQLGVVYPFEK